MDDQGRLGSTNRPGRRLITISRLVGPITISLPMNEFHNHCNTLAKTTD